MANGLNMTWLWHWLENKYIKYRPQEPQSEFAA